MKLTLITNINVQSSSSLAGLLWYTLSFGLSDLINKQLTNITSNQPSPNTIAKSYNHLPMLAKAMLTADVKIILTDSQCY